jgi:hypothetical protein
MEDSTYAEELQDHSNFPQLCPDVLNSENYTFCPHANCVTGLDPNSEKWVLVAVTCKRWGCAYCAVRKVRRLAWMTKNANPSKLYTTTVSNKRFADGQTAWDATSKAFPELIRWIRKEHGPCEYLRVLEVQANGMPHFHALVRTGFVLHRLVLAEWRRLIGVPENYTRDDPAPKEWAGVNIKAIDKSFATFRYLVKYLTKLHKLPWTDRHVSYSRDFFMPEDREQVEYAKLDSIRKHDQHPWVWLRERYGWDTVIVLGEGKWELPDYPNEPQCTVTPQQCGLPGAKPTEPELPISQRLVPGLEDAAMPSENDSLNASGKRRKAKPRPAAVLNPIVPTALTPF